MSPMSTRRLRWAAAAPLAALTLFGVAACGGGTAGAPAAAGGGHGAHPRSAAMQAYTQCLSSHGVTLPARGPTAAHRPTARHPPPPPPGPPAPHPDRAAPAATTT